MREVLSALHVTGFLGDTRGWYAPDRGGTLREEVPLVAEAALLASLRTAMQVGEFRAAGLLLPELGHPQSEVAGALLDILALEQQGDTQGALTRLQRWSAPSQLSEWRREAVHALVLHSKPGGGLMHLWNATQVRSPAPLCWPTRPCWKKPCAPCVKCGAFDRSGTPARNRWSMHSCKRERKCRTH